MDFPTNVWLQICVMAWWRIGMLACNMDMRIRTGKIGKIPRSVLERAEKLLRLEDRPKRMNTGIYRSEYGIIWKTDYASLTISVPGGGHMECVRYCSGPGGEYERWNVFGPQLSASGDMRSLNEVFTIDHRGNTMEKSFGSKQIITCL